MNKKILVISSLVIIIAVVIVLVISSSYPENEEEMAAGSIGKVDKYREANIQGYDIELRSDFIKEDSKIKQLVRDLTYYYITMNRLSGILGSINYTSFCGKLPDNNGNICDKLMDLREFVDNNREKLKTSIETFASAYDNDDPPKSDIENQMIQIADFHIQFMKKNDILNEVITDLDRVINNPNNSKNFQNMKDVIQIRDLLLITNLEIASVIGDNDNYEFATDQKIKNTDIIKDISSNNLKCAFLLENEMALNSVYSMGGNLEFLLSSKEGIKSIMGTLLSDEDILKLLSQDGIDNNNAINMLSVGPANSKLDIIVLSHNDLNLMESMEHSNKIIVFSGGMNDLKVYSKVDGLSFIIPFGIFGIAQNDLNSIMSQEEINSIMSQEDVKSVMSQEDIIKFLNQGQIGFFTNENIAKLFSFGIGNLNVNLGTFMGFPDALSGNNLEVLNARRNMDP